MRITQEEIVAFVQSIDAHMYLTRAELRLYGSRLRDDGRGGDIDLLLVVLDAKQYQAAIQQKARILVDMKEKIEDQKIDFMIVQNDHIHTDPFIDLIFDGSIILHQWS